MKAQLCAFILVATTAAAEPFSSGQAPLPSAGKGVRVPTPGAKMTTPAKKPAAAPKTGDRNAVEQYAENYFLKTYVPGSAGMRVMTAVAKAGEPEEVTGWPNKMRTTGTVALVVTYKGKDQKETRRFEAMLEGGKIVEFSTR